MEQAGVLLALCALVFQISGENVLFLYPNASPSHKNIGVPIMVGLAERGHNVTVVSSFKTEPHKNIRDIHPIKNFDYFDPQTTTLDVRRRGVWGMVFMDWSPTFSGCRQTYEDPEFQELLNQKFDLVLMDAFANECLLGLIYKLGAPFIYVSPLPVPGYISSHVGNRLLPSTVPIFMSDAGRQMSFVERLTSLVLYVLGTWGFRRPLSDHEVIYREYLGNDIPPADEILANMSLILSNSHFSYNSPRPTLPDVVEIGAIHCRPGRPLPKELEKFISEAKDGVILFSLGSIVRPQEMPEETRKIFVNVFSRLKQRVLWKWPKEMPDRPPNVMLSKWIPQQDVLAHPNIRLFITHAGLLSTQESIYHAVPMVSVPVIGDQDLNAKYTAESGLGVTLEILDMSEEKLETAINQVLNNTSYKERVKEHSSYLRDHLETPKERAIFWAEYIMRHKGAPHLRSAARNLNFFQYYCLDVIAVIVGVIIAIISVLILLIRAAIGILSKLVLHKKSWGKKVQ